MTKEEKINMINTIKSELDKSANIYLTDCSGLNADSTSKLRRACFKSNVKFLFLDFELSKLVKISYSLYTELLALSY